MANDRKLGHLEWVEAKAVALAPDYWPTEAWLSTTPEEQGMDSELLGKMLDFISAWVTASTRKHIAATLQKGYGDQWCGAA